MYLEHVKYKSETFRCISVIHCKIVFLKVTVTSPSMLVSCVDKESVLRYDDISFFFSLFLSHHLSNCPPFLFKTRLFVFQTYTVPLL